VIPVIVLRPEPGCDATVVAAQGRGLDARGFPLFRVEPRVWDAPEPESVDVLLLGSANALRHGGPALARYAGKPAYAVGEQTARAARAAGLDVVATGAGGLQQVLADIRPPHRRLLRLAGEARVTLHAPPGVTIIERVVYASVPTPLPDALASLLAQPALVMLHSAEAARHFAQECARRGVDRTQVALAALGPRIVAAAGERWRACEAADRPSEAALLALACRMCEGPDP
jgi:uroporphyrinogen-III synthase